MCTNQFDSGCINHFESDTLSIENEHAFFIRHSRNNQSEWVQITSIYRINEYKRLDINSFFSFSTFAMNMNNKRIINANCAIHNKCVTPLKWICWTNCSIDVYKYVDNRSYKYPTSQMKWIVCLKSQVIGIPNIHENSKAKNWTNMLNANSNRSSTSCTHKSIIIYSKVMLSKNWIKNATLFACCTEMWKRWAFVSVSLLFCVCFEIRKSFTVFHWCHSF